jgi:hypothetical protein
MVHISIYLRGYFDIYEYNYVSAISIPILHHVTKRYLIYEHQTQLLKGSDNGV